MARPKKAAPKKAKAVKTAEKTETTEAAAPAPVISTSKITIDKNVPIPATVRSGGVSPYPFSTMEVTDSFLIKSDVDADLYANDEEFGKALVEDFRVIANRLSGACRRFTKRNEGYKFRVKTVPAEFGVRVWRVE